MTDRPRLTEDELLLLIDRAEYGKLLATEAQLLRHEARRLHAARRAAEHALAEPLLTAAARLRGPQPVSFRATDLADLLEALARTHEGGYKPWAAANVIASAINEETQP